MKNLIAKFIIFILLTLVVGSISFGCLTFFSIRYVIADVWIYSGFISAGLIFVFYIYGDELLNP